ncbi:hypothetical protein MMC29_005499 [Sticta canariensis]|nr:hypothetical protein [Sticta canariensis]
MALVCSNAYCTIAASSSANGNEGCQVDPELKPYGLVILSFDETDEHADKLDAAFSGIARAVGSGKRDRYLAGLWCSNLVRCLCWNSGWHWHPQNPIFHPEMPEPITLTRQSEYLAPSWSWACLTGQVRYEWWIFHAPDPDPTAKATMFMPRVLEATMVPAGLDEYGSLKGGQIRLVGKMKPAFTRG